MDMSDVKILANVREMDEVTEVTPYRMSKSSAREAMDRSIARANELLERRKKLRRKRVRPTATETAVEVASVVAVIGTIVNVMFEVAEHIRR